MARRKLKVKDVFQLTAENEQSEAKPDIFQDRVSVEELRKIWNDKKVTYTDDELYRIREWLYVIAGAVVNVVENNSPEVLQEISKRRRKKPQKICPLYFVDEHKKAA